MPPKIKVFQVRLNQQDGPYSPGQTIDGCVILELNTNLSIRGIAVHFHGKADVEWEEGAGENVEFLKNEEIYLDDFKIVYGKSYDERAESCIFDPGQTILPFEYTLPSTIPASFQAQCGKIEYYVEAVIDQTKDKISTKVPFKIHRLVDLNDEPSAFNIPNKHMTDETDCCCLRAGFITASVRLNKGGFVPGENILIYGEVTNRSTRTIEKTKATLIQIVTYEASDKRKTISRWQICKVKHGAIPRGKSHCWIGESLRIPDVPPSRHDGSAIIDIRYYVKFAAYPGRWAKPIKIALDILIGTVAPQAAYSQILPFQTTIARIPAVQSAFSAFSSLTIQ